ncbi:MAG: hypothetical protein HQ561_14895 [Desulfobacteraceae bacterium]|nr:hypothetical protein [Desulfobacteraceae bacterium]
MKNVALILFVLVAFISPLFLSCGSDNDVSPVYDLRALSQLYEDFGSATTNIAARMNRKKLSGHPFLPSEDDIIPGTRGALAQRSAYKSEAYIYEYGDNAHLYWTKATGKDDLGVTIYTGTQTLDDNGFPTRRLWYDGEGNFDSAYDYIYDKALYLRTSYIEYRDDPTDNSDARRSYESLSEWNKYGILITRTAIEYDTNGIKEFEWKWRSVMQKNVLRGNGGFGFDEYYKEYEDGQLTYQSKVEFDSDGFPQTYSVDSNGDGTYDQTYQYDITKTDEGYLESVVFVGDGTDYDSWKTEYGYDGEGLFKTRKKYKASGDEFVLDAIYTAIWYRNPVNGPTGGEYTYFESDENGNPVGGYTTIVWTEEQKIYHNYSSLEKEYDRRTYALEKIVLP